MIIVMSESGFANSFPRSGESGVRRRVAAQSDFKFNKVQVPSLRPCDSKFVHPLMVQGFCRRRLGGNYYRQKFQVRKLSHVRVL